MASLENAAIILRLINKLNRKVTVTDLVDHLEMPKSSASRLLAQMKELGLLDREDSTRAYGPGVMILELSRMVRETTSLSAQMQDALKRLSAQSGHTGYISVLEGRDIMVLHVQQGSHPLRVTTYPGHRSPSWATSTGRVLLARDGEALTLGHFAEGLGDDFFGFRELGLDRELGLAGLSVPSRLFFGRGAPTSAVVADGERKVAPTYAPPPPVVLVSRASLPAQIGLLRPW